MLRFLGGSFKAISLTSNKRLGISDDGIPVSDLILSRIIFILIIYVTVSGYVFQTYFAYANYPVDAGEVDAGLMTPKQTEELSPCLFVSKVFER